MKPQRITRDQIAIPSEPGNTAHAVPTLPRLGAIRVVDPHAEISVARGRRVDDEQLIEADSQPAVGELPALGPGEGYRLADPVDDHEVVAEAMHLGESKFHWARSLGHAV